MPRKPRAPRALDYEIDSGITLCVVSGNSGISTNTTVERNPELLIKEISKRKEELK